MNTTKKIVSIMLAIAMMLAAAVTSFADTTGSITINNVSGDGQDLSGTTYKVYRIFEVLSYSESGNEIDGVSYKVTDEWKPFFAEGATGANYVEVDSEDGYMIKWKTNEDTEHDQVAEFAQEALKWAKEENIEATKSETAGDNAKQVVISELPLGYYLVDSSMGALCALTTTHPNATVNEKNSKPTITKQVKDGNTWKDANTASIGDTVEFRITASVGKGVENYVIHDTMDNGLIFDPTSVKINRVSTGTLVSATNYELKHGAACEDGDTFEIILKDEFLQMLTENVTNPRLYIYYSAKLGPEATIGAANPNENDVYLSYGKDHRTLTSTTKTYSYEFDVIKTDSAGKEIPDAVFSLYKTKTGGEAIKLVEESGGIYRVASEPEDTAEDAGKTIVTTFEAGKVTIRGLKNGTYYLDEVTAPAGYNPVTDRIDVLITNQDNLATKIEHSTDETDSEEDEVTADWDGGVQVVNLKGSELPSTGGIGTKIFYGAGLIMVFGAAILLVTKKRISSEQ